MGAGLEYLPTIVSLTTLVSVVVGTTWKLSSVLAGLEGVTARLAATEQLAARVPALEQQLAEQAKTARDLTRHVSEHDIALAVLQSHAPTTRRASP